MTTIRVVANRDVCPICGLFIGLPEGIGELGEGLTREVLDRFNKIMAHQKHKHLMEGEWERIEAGLE